MTRLDFLKNTPLGLAAAGATLLPAALPLAASAAPAAPLPVPPSDFNVRAFGATGDGHTRDTAALQAAIDACLAAGGGTVRVPPGNYFTGGLRLGSRLTLLLEPGATLLASRDLADYPGTDRPSRGYLLYAQDAEDLTIIGPGLLHGQAPEDLGERWGAPERPAFRTRIIGFDNCRRILLRHFTIRLCDSWTIVLRLCEDVKIDGVDIFNNVRRLNTDGIDPVSCRNVHISNCHIVTGDDSIVLKTEGTGGAPCENFVITNCICHSLASALKLGTGSEGDFRNILFSNCVVSGHTGLSLYMKDGGVAENVTFANITVQTPPSTVRPCTPIFVDLETRTPESRVSQIRNLTFTNIAIETGSSSLIQSIPEGRIENLLLENITIRVPQADSFQDRRKPKGGTSMRHPLDGVVAQFPAYLAVAHVHSFRLRGLRVFLSSEAARAQDRGALWVLHGRDLRLEDIRLESPGAPCQTPVVTLVEAAGVFLTGCVPAPGTPVFLALAGSSTGRVALLANDLRGAATPLLTRDGARPDLLQT